MSATSAPHHPGVDACLSSPLTSQRAVWRPTSLTVIYHRAAIKAANAAKANAAPTDAGSEGTAAAADDAGTADTGEDEAVVVLTDSNFDAEVVAGTPTMCGFRCVVQRLPSYGHRGARARASVQLLQLGGGCPDVWHSSTSK